MSPWLALAQPNLPLKRLLRRWPWWSVASRLRLDIYSRPYYAYGLQQACLQARALGHSSVAAIEFGVAGGNGLVAMEQIAAEVGGHFDIRVDVYGFDTGEGLPPPTDPRDLPFVWQGGQYRMDQAALKKRLQRAELILGRVADTAAPFAARDGAPLGFVAFDLDYYTSTMDAFHLFDALPPARRLPRVWCYFDDIIGKDDEPHCQHVGELAAIETFNATHERQKLGRVHGLRHKRVFQSGWNEQMFVLHDFDHPQYATYVSAQADKQATLR